MHWFFVPLVLVWVVFCILWGQVLRRMTGAARLLLSLIFVVIFGSGLAAVGYISMEFVFNKGPNDVGAMWHVGYPLSAKYGTFRQSSYQVRSFEKDPDASGSGTYHIHFQYNDHSGTVLSHYNRPARSFDHDEVETDN